MLAQMSEDEFGDFVENYFAQINAYDDFKDTYDAYFWVKLVVVIKE